jgi:SAM-dependent methyltransferase
MSRKSTPKFPDSYTGDKSQEYAESIWMERNQKRSTISCLQYLLDSKLDEIGKKDIISEEISLILDLGCGTGFSSEIIAAHGYYVIGVDVLKDMLYKTQSKKKDLDEYRRIFLILADINHLPLRNKVIDHVISVSAYNFSIHGLVDRGAIKHRLNSNARILHELLNYQGRVIIEFYPQDDEELNFFSSSFINNGFNGFMIKKQDQQKTGQTFLLLKKID